MSHPFDLSQFPDLPPEVAKAFVAIQFELSVERAARQHEQAVVAEKDAFITELKALIEKLEGQVQEYPPVSRKLSATLLFLYFTGGRDRTMTWDIHRNARRLC